MGAVTTPYTLPTIQDRNEIPTVTPIRSGARNLTALLGILCDVTGSQKSKIAASIWTYVYLDLETR